MGDKTSRPDPLDRLRRLGVGDTAVARELRLLADSWLSERRQHGQNISRMVDRVEVLESNELENAEDNDRIRAERDDLQSKLDASMPLPLDADGYVWDSYEEEFLDPSGKRHEIDNLGFTQGRWLIEESNGKWYPWYPADACWHVMEDLPQARKPYETIDDVRTYVRDTDVSSLVERAYGCGKRDGGTR